MRMNLSVEQFHKLKEDWVNSKLVFLMSENIVNLENRDLYKKLLYTQFYSEYASNLDFNIPGR